jgi:hypothetical protein
MTSGHGETDPARNREAAWAQPVSKLTVSDAPADVINLNVAGRRVVGPMQGFGQLWQKTYRVALHGAKVTPQEVIAIWKANFPRFWPEGSRFHAPLTSIAPGEVALINLPIMPAGLPLSTGVLVIYADDVSFSFMSPEGHMFAGMITFSADAVDGTTYAQAQVLIRANDPLWEIVARISMFRKEDEFWCHTLKSLAAYFGVSTEVETRRVCVDPRLQWSKAGNVWQNAAVRSFLFTALGPLRWVRDAFGRRTKMD